jgi:hypothetical protein
MVYSRVAVAERSPASVRAGHAMRENIAFANVEMRVASPDSVNECHGTWFRLWRRKDHEAPVFWRPLGQFDGTGRHILAGDQHRRPVLGLPLLDEHLRAHCSVMMSDFMASESLGSDII